MTAPSRILIIRFGALGDIVLTSPATRALHRQYPEARIAMAVKRMYAPLAGLLPGVDEVLALDTLDRLIAQVRARGFDTVIDLHANLRSRILTRFSGARRVIRYRKRHVARMSMVYARRLPIPHRHTVDLYLDALAALGIRAGERQPGLTVTPSARRAIRDRLRACGIEDDHPVIGLAPGASSPAKRWPASRFAALANRYAADHRILLIGGPQDHPATAAVARAMTAPAVDWTAALDLDLLPAAIARCRLLVSNDTGPMHVASAVNTPVIGLFGPTHPRLGFSPLGPHAVALSLNAPCSPCSLHGNKPCWKKNRACLMDLSVDQVSTRINHIFQNLV